MVSTDAPLRLHRQHQAGTNDIAVHAHRAGAANAMLAADMRSRQLQMLAQEVRQIEARQDLRVDALAVDLQARSAKRRVTKLSPQQVRDDPEARQRNAPTALWQDAGASMRSPADLPADQARQRGPGMPPQQRRRDGDIDQFCGCPGQYRPIADGKEGQPKVGRIIVFHDRLRRQADNGVIAVTPREFAEEMRGILWRGRQFRRRPTIHLPTAPSHKSP